MNISGKSLSLSLVYAEMTFMELSDQRIKLQHLAEDLGWLESHCRQRPELGIHTAHLRLAAALTRNVLGPAAEGELPPPLHLAVVGGAGAGKSTIVNLLAGSVVAEANPQAGYTRHPTAFLPSDENFPWPAMLGFLGPLQRLTTAQPGNLDQDVYQTRRRPALPGDSPDPLGEFVIWDCPDMTTWEASGYIPRLLEVVALADVVIYVASDERYNDEVPTQFLHLLVQSGKTVIVCLTKVREAEAQELENHFRQEVLGRLPIPDGMTVPPIPCRVIPQLSAEVLGDPTGLGASHRIGLINQILVLCPHQRAVRSRTFRNALCYLRTAADGLLEVARQDLAELQAWRDLVSAGREEFEERYRRDFLAAEAFRRFDRTRDQVLAMLELPGPGKVLSNALGVLRLPWRYLRDVMIKTLSRPSPPQQSERSVCLEALNAWLDGLLAESLQRAGNHPVWKQIARTLETTLKPQAVGQFDEAYRHYERQETDELDRTAQAIPEYLSQHPLSLSLLRVVVAGSQLLALGLVIYWDWPPGWELLILLPLSVAVVYQLVEFAVWQVVEIGRNRVKDHREVLIRERLSLPLAAWIAERPVTEGSSLEQLQRVLTRIPLVLRALDDAWSVTPPLASSPASS